jgi:spore coat protein U-like protein
MKRKLALAALFLIAFGARPVLAACTLSISALNFGTYTGTLINSTALGTVTSCTGSWSIPLNAGTGIGATETIRKMTAPSGATLNYHLFTDAARTNNWGNTTGNMLTGSGNASITVYGQLTAGQNVAPGTYTDTVSSATTSFNITAVIPASCLVSATNMAFGAYTGVATNSTSTLSVTCTNTSAYNVGLNAGTASNATVTNRSMTGPGGALLHYSLFSNSGRTTNWGNTVGTDTVAGTGNGNAQSLTVYGQIPAAQSVAPGSYTDTITATLTY